MPLCRLGSYIILQTKVSKEQGPTSSVVKCSTLQRDVISQAPSPVQTSGVSSIKGTIPPALASTPFNRDAALLHQRDTVSEAASVPDFPLVVAAPCHCCLLAKSHTSAGECSGTCDPNTWQPASADFWFGTHTCAHNPDEHTAKILQTIQCGYILWLS